MREQSFSLLDGLSYGLISTGAKGNHLLFDPESIRRAFSRVEHGLIEESNLLSAHRALRHLGKMHDLLDMRCFINDLPSETVDLIVFIYFRSLDQYMSCTPFSLH